MIADKGYDGDKVLQTIHDQGGQAVIPPRSNRKVPDSNEFHVRVKKPGSQGASEFSVFF